jgi:ubiquinone/menaquinone biosynthesis C-methylase UbiE
LSPQAHQPQIIDYEGSRYRTDFWEGQGREYEDLAERAAIQRLLPLTGSTLIEAGAGFGRLAGLYAGYQRVVLMDYSLSLLQEAQQAWGHDNRFVFVAASVYDMPFVADLFEAMVMVRVMHHLQMPGQALIEIGRIVRGGGTFVLEFANKRNLKSMARYALRRQRWSPFAAEPYEFVPLNYDFHPDWMKQQIREAGFGVRRELAISSFRLAGIKRFASPSWLARLDAALAGPAAIYPLSPSVMVQCVPEKALVQPQGFFQCPDCHSTDLADSGSDVTCTNCQRVWTRINGIYDFRRTVSRETQ